MALKHPTPRGRSEPVISWEQDFDTLDMKCQVRVPTRWMMESSEFKRKLLLWWWLTRLAWRLPK